MKEILKEVLLSILQHRLRSFLTGISITWGMFILIILLGAGNGFRSGILNIFSGYASNSLWVTGHIVSESSIEGLQTGTNIYFTKDVIAKMKNRFPQIKLISTEINLTSSDVVNYMGNFGHFQIKGIQKDYMSIKFLEINKGRFFNELDYKKRDQIAIIGKQVKDLLFGDIDCIGKSVEISGVFFQVVGVIEEGTIFSAAEKNNIYIPVESLLDIFNLERKYNTFGVLLDENVSTEYFEEDLRSFLSREIGFNKSDRNALFINNVQLQIKTFNSLFDGFNRFLWILGMCFLLSGMLGVMNIMLVVVKERTKEIGIRKAIGATPNSIIQLIISESLIITCSFGALGLILGYAGLFFYNWAISSLQDGQQVAFEKGYIDLSVAFIALIMLVISGVIAGVFPAKKAAEIMPVETLKTD
jgi:putative ABC transport system permease protein